MALDEAYLGRTPLRARIDPRLDHVLALEREACEPHTLLLTTDAWKGGRSPQVLVRLDCR